jgi:hypothetical protein
MSVLGEVVLKFEGEDFLSEEAARSGLILLGALLLSFLFIRTSARLMRSPKVSWWPGSIETEGGLHVHHLVFGIVLMLIAGFVLALQPGSPWLEIMAGAFGIGAGLTLDEYALWLHLEDVYWSEEGRRSVDAVVIATLLGGLLLMGFLPFSTADGALDIVASMIVVLVISAIAILKGKIVLGVAGVLFAPVGLVGAIRLAKPDSPWARRRYPEDGPKMARARKRYQRHERRYQRFQDQVAGAPSVPPPSDTATDSPSGPRV